MDSVEKIILTENILRARIERLIENGKKTNLSKRTQGFYESKITELKKLWEVYSDTDMAINQALLESSDERQHEYLTQDNYSTTELKYSEYMGELIEGLRKFVPATEASSSGQVPIHSTTVVQQESFLPRIQLPKYNGNYDLWRSFHDLFISLVHDNTKLTPVQKLHHLKSCLVGDAEKLLRHTPVTNEDYMPAWNKLKARYENKRILVNHQLKVLVNQAKLNSESAKGLKSIIDTTDECIQQLQSLEVDTTSWDVLLIHLLVQKLPFITLKLWEEEQGGTQELPTFKSFKQFLSTRLRILESLADSLVKSTQPKSSCTPDTTKSYHITKGIKCPACNESHFLQRCPNYHRMDIPSRYQIIKASSRCTNCLGLHHVNNCTSKYSCQRCNKKHHSTLHEEHNRDKPNHAAIGTEHKSNTNNVSSNSSQVNQASNTFHKRSPRLQSVNNTDDLNTSQNFVTREDHNALLSTALVVAQTKSGNSHILRCLIDSGSQSSFITEEACRKLGACRSPTAVSITGLNTSHTAISKQQTTLTLRSRKAKSTRILEENFLIMNKITDPLPSRIISKRECLHLTKLPLADPTFWKPGKVDALLGARVYAQIVLHGIKQGSNTTPTAIKTIFGWILLGSTTNIVENNTSAFTVTTDDLAEQLKMFWETEEFPTNPILNKEDRECQQRYQLTHQRLHDGTYQVKLPFVNDEVPDLGQSRPQAIKRFQGIQRQLQRNQTLKSEYERCLDEYLELGHMEEIPPPNNNEPHYYIPHHAVVKESTTTKVRVVFDASARTSNGNSLNEFLLKGPVLQPKLFATLLNWRKYKIAMNADIEKMYRMITMHPDHRTFQRIIWRHPKTKEIQDFQLKTVTFGTSSAPYLAIQTLQQLACDEQQRWPRASKVTTTDFYVDDLLTGAESIEDAKDLLDDLISMLKAGGFNLRKWTSNNSYLLKHLPPEQREFKDTLMISDTESVKTLGIRWHPKSDKFSFLTKPWKTHAKVTKRTILSDIASLYDPLGWLAPVVITAKVLMQSLWVTGCAWDNKISEAIEHQWDSFKNNLKSIDNLQIPRWINYSSNAQIQIHGFCDASTKAFAAAVYLRVGDESGMFTTTLLTAKTRVAPIKPTTIPRLELNGALLLARLLQATMKDMRLQQVPVFAWTDSTIVLQWIKEHPSRWKTYVANRVVEIQDIIRFEQWRHVSTNHNPADVASRGVPAAELINNQLWWHGPSWLSAEQDAWPKFKDISEQTNLEAKEPIAINLLAKVDNQFLLRYSSYTRLVRIVAMMQRFIHNCRHPQNKRSQYIDSLEWSQAELTIFKLVQQTAFADEYKIILNKNPLSQNSKLIKLNPFMDDNGLLRVGGRLDNASIPYNRKHPVILPRDHHVTLILIDKLHVETLHGGPSLVLSTSRNRFWILDARRCITSRLHKCITCFKYRTTTRSQLMGNLPTPRVNETKPFTKVGIDYAGPVTIRSSKLRNAKLQKAYFCIFVCMATKAVHLELVSDLTSEAFLAALKRFVARRGLCTDIYSDCGTNFIGGKSLLEKDLQQAIHASTPEAATYLSSKQINWHFNPPASPHFGGIWEAGVKSVKYHLRRTLQYSKCTFEEYATLLAQVEACLNSRPLCYVRNDPADLFILTPGHFLIGQALNAIPEPDYTNEPVVLSKRWQYIQQLNKQFWYKWSKDYLNQLQNRPKWYTRQPNMHVGDVVLVKSENMPPTSWAMGIIEQIHPGADELVRVVRVKTRNGSFLRPIAKISPLPLA